MALSPEEWENVNIGLRVGRKQGFVDGYATGEERMAFLLKILLEENRTDLLEPVANNPYIRRRLLNKYQKEIDALIYKKNFERGVNDIITLAKCLLKDDRMDDFKNALDDADIRNELLKEYDLL